MKKHYCYIDLLKFIAIYFVILIHNYSCSTDFIINNDFKVYFAYSFRLFIEGVLIFVFVNGFLLNNKNLDLTKNIKKIFKIFSLIIFWSIIYIIFFSILNHENINFKHIISNVLLTDISNKYSGILWFLQNLICLYLIYPVLTVCKEHNKKVYNYIFIVVIMFTVGSNLIHLFLQMISAILHMNNITQWIEKFINMYNPISNGYFILYFMFGSYAFDNIEIIKKNKKKIYVLGAFSIVIPILYGIIYSNITIQTYSNNFNYSTIFMMMFILFMFTLSLNYKVKLGIISKYINFVGSNSLGIYFFHIIVIRVLKNYFVINSFIMVLLYSLFVLVISSFLTYIMSKIPILKKCIRL